MCCGGSFEEGFLEGAKYGEVEFTLCFGIFSFSFVFVKFGGGGWWGGNQHGGFKGFLHLVEVN